MTSRPALRLLLPLAILALALAVLAVLVLTRPAGHPVPVRERTWTVDVETIRPQTLSPVLQLYGQVDNPRTARLAAAVAAEVLEVPAREGARVAAGDLLVRLDDRDQALLLAQRDADVQDLRAQLATERLRERSDRTALEHEQALLELARRAVSREQTLSSSKVGSEARLDEARQSLERQALAVETRRLAVASHGPQLEQLQARLARAEAQRDQARLDLGRTRIPAPFQGRIARLEVSPGDRVRVGDPLLVLFDESTLELRAQLPAPRIAGIRRALETGVALTARGELDGHPVMARLTHLAAETTPGRGGIDALLRVESGAERLQLGRTLELTLSLPPLADVVAVPPAALYGGNRIYKLVDGRMAAVDVTRLGETAGDDGPPRLLVRGAGLAAGDRLVTTQLPNAAEGLAVRPAAAETR